MGGLSLQVSLRDFKAVGSFLAQFRATLASFFPTKGISSIFLNFDHPLLLYHSRQYTITQHFPPTSSNMPPRKTKKTADTLNSRLALVMKSGKVTLGFKSARKTLRSGKAKLVIIAGNCPPLRKSELECKSCC